MGKVLEAAGRLANKQQDWETATNFWGQRAGPCTRSYIARPSRCWTERHAQAGQGARAPACSAGATLHRGSNFEILAPRLTPANHPEQLTSLLGPTLLPPTVRKACVLSSVDIPFSPRSFTNPDFYFILTGYLDLQQWLVHSDALPKFNAMC